MHARDGVEIRGAFPSCITTEKSGARHLLRQILVGLVFGGLLSLHEAVFLDFDRPTFVLLKK